MKFNKNILYLFIAIIFGLSSCRSAIKVGKTETTKTSNTETVVLDTFLVEGKKAIYNPSEKRVNDLLHTKIDIRFDWKKQWAYGKANLILKPYFYPTQNLQLDAKGFDIKEIALITSNDKQKLDYTYDGKIADIDLGKSYTRDEEYEIWVDYIAKPNELEEGGSAAITSDKGLYFINPNEQEKNKPRQLWTQGETESSSCWFPTIDSPNERTTQEMMITVDAELKTISNGKLLNQIDNGDGTRTDHWKQVIPHAPYLFMMAVGPFSEVEDSWNGIPMNYYVDDAYAKHAKKIFENTGEMLTFFSEKFGMDYMWDKYHQVVVHDFVSGAMENTGAVIHFSGLHQTEREMLDGSLEDIIAHEAAHHWFGDYVTCESWANIPLNEAFATWAEIIWEEHKYGRDAAELKVLNDRLSYFDEAEKYQEPLIRYYHSDKEDMFDRHSYQKGGQVLWMLQNYLGDEAYYAGLKKYLEDNALQSVEIHNLRIALEAVCGEDLNWFFNQWFLRKGHPELSVNTYYDHEMSEVVVSVEQQQDLLFELPVKVAIHFADRIDTRDVLINEKENTFTFNVPTKPQFIDFDPGKYLLAKIEELKKPVEQYVRQYENTSGFLSHQAVFENLVNYYPDDDATKTLYVKALDNPFYAIRDEAIKNIDIEDTFYNIDELKEKLLDIAKNDTKTRVRGTAITKLSHKIFNLNAETIAKFTEDKSYLVISSALYGLNNIDSTLALQKAETLTKEPSIRVQSAVASIMTASADKKYNTYFKDYCDAATGYTRFAAIRNYGAYLKNINDEQTIADASEYLKECAQQEKNKWLRYYAAESIFIKRNELMKQQNNLIESGNSAKITKGLSEQKIGALVSKLDKHLMQIKDKETDETILSYYKHFVK